MITLRISFLLAINREENADKPKRKPKNKKRKGKSKSSKASKKSKKKTKIRKVLNEEEDSDYIPIQVKKPISYIHIDYGLFSGKFKYTVDILCWDSVAKIFTKNGTKSVKTVIREKIAWVPVFLEHYLNPLPTETIRDILKEMITVRITIGKKSVGKQAKTDKSSVFYLHKNDINNEYFPELFNQKPKTEDELRKLQIERIFNKLLLSPIDSEIVTWIYNMDDVHAYKIASIITKKSQNGEIYCKDFYRDEKMRKLKTKNKKSKKKKRNKKEKSSKMDFKIPAHVFLSDPHLAVYQIDNGGNRLGGFILLSSNNILTIIQKKELCPLLVKIRNICNLPDEILRENRFTEVYLSCDIPGVAEVRTYPKLVNKKLVFDESKFIIVNDVPNIKILEVLETRRVLVKIIGVRSSLPKSLEPTKPKKKKSKSKTQLSKPENFEHVILAVSPFDLSSLTKNFFHFREKSQSRAPNTICYRVKPVQFHITEPYVNHFTMIKDDEDIDSPLTDTILFENVTTVKLEARFLIPCHPLFYITDISRNFKRLVMIVSKEEEAKQILTSIMSHNNPLMGVGPLILPNYLAQREISLHDRIITADRDKILSGFLIDDGNCFIFFIEGPSNGYILNIYHQISKVNFSTARVFYNTEYLFEERLYDSFHMYSGIIVVTLKLPLMKILAQSDLYIEGNVPKYCLKALQKLHLLVNSHTLKTILNHNALPTEVELVALSIEYGVNFRFTNMSMEEVKSFHSYTINCQTEIK